MGRALGLNIGGAAELRTPIPNTCRTERQGLETAGRAACCLSAQFQ